MSTYKQFTVHPKTGKWEEATWKDDYFGSYHYGVIFPSDGSVFDPWENPPRSPVLRIAITAAEAATLNAEFIRQNT